MRKHMNRVISALLAVCLTLTAAPLTGFVGLDFAPKAKAYAVGDHIQYGTYPQSRVTDTALIAQLNAAPKTWKSYNYYSGTGKWDDGQMVPSDYMRFADFFVGSAKYRAVTFSEYRPYCTGYTQSASNSNQDENGYMPNRIYYFLYEPINWQILNPTDGLILNEMILDSQAYQNTVYMRNAFSLFFQDTSNSTYASDYAASSIRNWLNYDFYETAFTDAQKSSIRNDVTLNNDSAYGSIFNSVATQDKIFLISYDEAVNMLDNEALRCARGTDYAQCQGLYVYRSSDSVYDGFASWWLRSPCHSYSAGSVKSNGYPNDNKNDVVSSTSGGVRAACRLSNLKSDISQSQNLFSETVGGSGTDPSVSETVTFTTDEGTGEAEITFDPVWFAMDSEKYQHGLARFCSQFSMIGYVGQKRIDQLEYALQTMGFGLIEDDLDTQRDEVNYFIASKTVTVNSEKNFIVFMGLIGSNKMQWNSDFDPYGVDRKANSGNGYSGFGNKGTVHLGFEDAKQFAYNKLFDYINCIYHDPSAKTKIVLTGHSRGAAAANLLAKDLIDSSEFAAKEDIYTYTFATPNNTKNPSHAKKYERIFNIVNPTDFVTKVLPTAWKFGRYGTTYALPTRNNTDPAVYRKQKNRMLTAFDEYADVSFDDYETGEIPVWRIITRMTARVGSVNQFYYAPADVTSELTLSIYSAYHYFISVLCPIVNNSGDAQFAYAVSLAISIFSTDVLQIGLFSRFTSFFLANNVFNNLNGNFKIAHLMQTYCAYMMELSEAEITAPKSSNYFSVNCPVDVEVYDENGELVGRIVNNAIDEAVASGENAISMFVDGDEKIFALPANGNYEVKYVGNDNGTMDLTVSELDEDLNEVQRVNYFDVEVNEGKTYTGVLTEDENITEYELIEDNGEVVAADEILEAEDLRKITVEVYGGVNNEITQTFSVSSGDYVAVTPTLSNCDQFSGWYVDGEIVSTEPEYRFRPESDITLTASITTEHTWNDGEITTPATCKDAGVKTFTCTVCGETKTEEIAKLTTHTWNEGEITKPATLTEAGEKTFTCTVCGATKTEPIDKLPDVQPEYNPGDVDGDGNVTAADARLALRRAVELETYPEGSAEYLACDVDHDGKVTAGDARVILRAAVGLESLN